MAAAEYFSNAPLSQSTPQPYQQQSQPPTSYPQPQPQTNTYQPPPNYQQSNSQQHAHFAPIPVETPQRHSFSGQQRPSMSSSPQNTWNNSPYNNPYQQQNMALQSRPPQSYGSPYSTGSNSPHQRPQHLAPHMRPYANPNSSQYSLDQGYASDPEPRRHRQHKQRERSGRERAVSDDKRSHKSRSKNTDGLLGAAGGGLIGDLIFPGLGTVGGAALGYIGGRDYGKHRKDREEKLAHDQREWEEKYRPHLHHSDRSRDNHHHRSRDTSRQDRDRDRPRSYERRKDDY